MEHIHARGVIHRDLKPGNIFITRDGTVKIMDFGVARVLDGRDPAQRGTMVGTLLYIAPEQINGRETDFRSDIYTLGVSLFETVTGRLPFERRTDYALMHAHVQETPPRPRQFERRLPPALEEVILKAIEKEPSRRFQSVAEFREALLTLGLVERRGMRPPRRYPRRGRRPPSPAPGRRYGRGTSPSRAAAHAPARRGVVGCGARRDGSGARPRPRPLSRKTTPARRRGRLRRHGGGDTREDRQDEIRAPHRAARSGKTARGQRPRGGSTADTGKTT